MRRRDTPHEGSDDAALSVCARVMQDRARPHRILDMPGEPGVRVAIVCPSEAEETEADVEARKFLTKTMKLAALELSLAHESELSRREREIELLALCVRSAEDIEESFWESSDEARERLEKPQRKALIAAIEDFRAERFEAKTPAQDAEIVRLVRGLKEVGALSTFWTSCDDDTRWNIVNALAMSLTAPSSSDS